MVKHSSRYTLTYNQPTEGILFCNLTLEYAFPIFRMQKAYCIESYDTSLCMTNEPFFSENTTHKSIECGKFSVFL